LLSSSADSCIFVWTLDQCCSQISESATSFASCQENTSNLLVTESAALSLDDKAAPNLKVHENVALPLDEEIAPNLILVKRRSFPVVKEAFNTVADRIKLFEDRESTRKIFQQDFIKKEVQPHETIVVKSISTETKPYLDDDVIEATENQENTFDSPRSTADSLQITDTDVNELRYESMYPKTELSEENQLATLKPEEIELKQHVSVSPAFSDFIDGMVKKSFADISANHTSYAANVAIEHTPSDVAIEHTPPDVAIEHTPPEKTSSSELQNVIQPPETVLEMTENKEGLNGMVLV